MKTVVNTYGCNSLRANMVRIESSFTRGFAGTQLIGNTAEICKEGKERAKAALESIGYVIPNRRLVVNLMPADLKKNSNHFDLPIATSIGLLLTQDQPLNDPENWLFAAELSLKGSLRPVKGIVSFAIAAVSKGLEGIVIAKENLKDAGVLLGFGIKHFERLKIYSFETLDMVLDWLFNNTMDNIIQDPTMMPDSYDTNIIDGPHKVFNFDDMVLSPQQRRAALCSASGLHSLLLRGSPGTGKSMLASRLPSILPPIPKREHLEALQIYSSMYQKLPPFLLSGTPPFRNPHHAASAVAILGSVDSPGELSLAHGGILFLDELPEFRRDLLESLREPLETGEVKVSRAQQKVTWASRVILVAACNNCPCGWFGSSRRKCSCTMQKLINYRLRLSGPILDRIDIHFNIPEAQDITKDLLFGVSRKDQHEKTSTMRETVIEAREFAFNRNKGLGIEYNRDIQAAHIHDISGLPKKELERLLRKYITESSTGRSIIRSIRVARTLADLDASVKIREQDFATAWGWQAENSAKERGEMVYGIS